MSIEVVYATGTAMVDLPNGARGQIAKGTHWPATDPVVQAHPALFSADPRWGMLYTTEPEGYDAPIGDEVEQATSAPGEKRSARRG